MTIKEMRDSDKTMLTPAEVAEVLGADPQTIRVSAHQRPEGLGFPVIVMGSRVKIPREAFLKFLAGE